MLSFSAFLKILVSLCFYLFTSPLCTVVYMQYFLGYFPFYMHWLIFFNKRFSKIAIPNNKFQIAMDKEAISLSRVQQFSHLCVARPYQISVKSIFKHIHTTSINTIIWQFVPFIYHPL